MKKVALIIAVIVFALGILVGSCGTQHTCPTYMKIDKEKVQEPA